VFGRCSLHQAQEMIRRKITEKTTSGPAELRRAFQFMVSLKRLGVESTWLQLTSACQRG
jgi:hypothetical protein